MHAILMCGGRGRRLGPLGSLMHKSLFPVAGSTFIERLIRQLATEMKVESVLVIADHRREQLAEYLAAVFGDDELSITVTPVTAPGTAGALRQAAQGVQEPFVYCHGNIAFEPAVVRTLASSLNAGVHNTLGVVGASENSVAPTHPHLRLSDEGRVVEVRDGQAEGWWCSIGLAVLTAAAVGCISDTDDSKPVEVALADCVGQQVLRSVDVGRDWRHLEDLSFYS